MSFDLYFVPRPTDDRWDSVMDDIEQAAAADERDLTSEELELWARIVDAVMAEAPTVNQFDGDGYRELDDEAGMQLSMSPGELSLTTPYWFEGEDAERAVEKLRRVSTVIENVTGLIAYDPQAEAPFLNGGAESAAATFDHIAVVMSDHLDLKSPTRSAAPRWAFWRR